MWPNPLSSLDVFVSHSFAVSSNSPLWGSPSPRELGSPAAWPRPAGAWGRKGPAPRTAPQPGAASGRDGRQVRRASPARPPPPASAKPRVCGKRLALSRAGAGGCGGRITVPGAPAGPRAASPPRPRSRYYCQVPSTVFALLSITTNSSSFALFSLRRGFLQSLPLPAGSRSAEPLEIEGFTVKMKISLQIILADARSPGRASRRSPLTSTSAAASESR